MCSDTFLTVLCWMRRGLKIETQAGCRSQSPSKARTEFHFCCFLFPTVAPKPQLLQSNLGLPWGKVWAPRTGLPHPTSHLHDPAPPAWTSGLATHLLEGTAASHHDVGPEVLHLHLLLQPGVQVNQRGLRVEQDRTAVGVGHLCRDSTAGSRTRPVAQAICRRRTGCS